MGQSSIVTVTAGEGFVVESLTMTINISEVDVTKNLEMTINIDPFVKTNLVMTLSLDEVCPNNPSLKRSYDFFKTIGRDVQAGRIADTCERLDSLRGS